MKKIFFLLVAILFCISAYSQDETVIELQAAKGPYVTNGFWDNWFVSAGGGIQVYFGKNDTYGSFGKRISPALDVSVGKWLTPSTGVRLQYSGLQGKGWTYGKLPYSDGNIDSKGYYKEKFNSMNIHADFLWNISNAIGGERIDRFWNFVPYAGFGWARSNGNSTHKNEIAATFGLLHNLRISPALDVNIEMKAMMVNQRFVFSSGNDGANFMGTVTAGLTYKFYARGFQRASDLVVVEDNSTYINEINSLQDMLAKANANREKLVAQLAAERAKEAKVVTQMYPVLPDFAIFFEINRAKITEESEINVGYMADVIKRVPDKKFILYASADKETGTPAFNLKLSQKRGEAVYNLLVDKFGVDPNQLVIEAVGSAEQRFSGAKLNRVVIIEDNE